MEETISTLRFADRAHQVMTFAQRNEDRPVDHLVVKELRSEIEYLKALLEKHDIEYRKPIHQRVEDGSDMLRLSPSDKDDVHPHPTQCEQMETKVENSCEIKPSTLDIYNKKYPAHGGFVKPETPRHLITRQSPISSASAGLLHQSVVSTPSSAMGKIPFLVTGDNEADSRAASLALSYQRLTTITNQIKDLVSDFLSFAIEEEELKACLDVLVEQFEREVKRTQEEQGEFLSNKGKLTSQSNHSSYQYKPKSTNIESQQMNQDKKWFTSAKRQREKETPARLQPSSAPSLYNKSTKIKHSVAKPIGGGVSKSKLSLLLQHHRALSQKKGAARNISDLQKEVDVANEMKLKDELRVAMARREKKERLYEWMVKKEQSGQVTQSTLHPQTIHTPHSGKKDKRYTPEEVQKTSLKQKKEQMREYFINLKRELRFLEETIN